MGRKDIVEKNEAREKKRDTRREQNQENVEPLLPDATQPFGGTS